MIDNLSILLSHALLLFMFYHVIYRDDLDEEAPPPKINLDADTSRYRPVRAVQKAKDVKAITGGPASTTRPSPCRRAVTSAKGRNMTIGGRRDA